MGAPINRVESWTASDYDMIIDVRSPAEFADDHLPGAVNLPVLNNDQRAEIGTMYKQISPFAAKRAGAALVAGNIAQHIGSALKDADRNFRPLVYCWRGGQRSSAMARIFSEIGWQTDLVDGGYKRYRKQVLDGLDSLPQHLNLVVLRGRTGLAKTHILQAALARGAQVIDLEALANHRGSLLGPEPDGEQPPQRLFES
ncbi:MAG: tRNA 2-selenouridine(34) synthase MnmH, partial [Candidatus Puniceispirillaceae bacterium]